MPSASAARERQPKTASRVDPNLTSTRCEVTTPRSEGPDALDPVKHPARTLPLRIVEVMRAAVVVARRVRRASSFTGSVRQRCMPHQRYVPVPGIWGIFRVHDSSIEKKKNCRAVGLSSLSRSVRGGLCAVSRCTIGRLVSKYPSIGGFASSSPATRPNPLLRPFHSPRLAQSLASSPSPDLVLASLTSWRSPSRRPG